MGGTRRGAFGKNRAPPTSSWMRVRRGNITVVLSRGEGRDLCMSKMYVCAKAGEEEEEERRRDDNDEQQHQQRVKRKKAFHDEHMFLRVLIVQSDFHKNFVCCINRLCALVCVCV